MDPVMLPIITVGDMDKIYLDIMVNGRFYRQIPINKSYTYDYNEMVRYVEDKFPSLINKEWSAIEGRRVFR